MTSSSVLSELSKELGAVEVHDVDYDQTGSHLDVTVAGDGLRAAVQALEAKGFFLEDLTAVDYESHREVIYRFNVHQGPRRITIRVDAGDADAVETITDIYPAANWMERECNEFLGVSFQGHPDMRRLLLPEDTDFHPLRKDFVVPKEALAPEYHRD